MLEDLEFRYEQLHQRLGAEPRGPITVWEFPSAESKKSLVGAGNTLFARPWTREIFVQGDRFPSLRLRHEMAHVFAGAFGDPLFGVSLAWRWHGPLPLPTLASGLVEGIAEAADAGADDDESTIHQEAAAMIAAGRAPPLESVVGAGFSAQSGARAYTIAGSFCRFLLETRGAAAMQRLYRSAGDFVAAYGVPLPTLEAQWRDFLGRQPLDAQDRARASEQFRRPAIFKKVCARELAARLSQARAVMATEPERAMALLEETCADDPHEPIYRLALGEAWAASGRFPRALELTTQLSADGDLTVPMQARVASLAGTLYFLSGDYANAECGGAARARARARRGRPADGVLAAARAGATERAPDAGARAVRRSRGRGRRSGAGLLPDQRVRAPVPARPPGAVPDRTPAPGARRRARAALFAAGLR